MDKATTAQHPAPEKVWDVISPDGFSIHAFDTYPTEEAAEKAFTIWKERYRAQGYYSSNRGRIDLDDLRDYCRIVEIDNPEISE